MSHSGMVPVFIGGCGRSGTTLLGAILGANRACLCVPEFPFKIDALRHNGAATPVRDLVAFLLKTRRFRHWGLDAPALARRAAQFDGSFREALEWLVREFGRGVNKPAPSVWVDHTPENARYATTLAELFPEAKFLHIIRDGRAVAASILPLDWGPSTIDKAARWWLESLAFGLAAETWGGSERVLRVRYEDLVLNGEPAVRRVSAFLGLQYDPAMLQADGFRVPGYTADQHALVGSAPQPARVTAWERELTARQVEIFEAITGEMLPYLGYELRFGGRARKATRSERLALRFHDVVSDKIVNRIRLRRRRTRSG